MKEEAACGSAAGAGIATIGNLKAAGGAAHACGCGRHESGSGAAGHACACRGLRIWRRSHGAIGLFFGGFVVLHLMAVSTAVAPARFDQNGRALHLLAGNFRVIELFLIWLPLLVLTFLGCYLLWKTGLSYRIKRCKRGGPLRFFLQRLSAVILLAFLAMHLVTFLYVGAFDPDRPFVSTVAAIARPAGPNPWNPLNLLAIAVYALGIMAVAWHLANGVTTAAQAWDVCTSAVARRRLSIASGIFGVTLGLAGGAALGSLLLAR